MATSRNGWVIGVSGSPSLAGAKEYDIRHRSAAANPRRPAGARAEAALCRERDESQAAYETPWPLAAWPAVPTRFVLCTEDRFLPPAFVRRVVAERLGVVPDEIAAGHCVALSRPRELADLLVGVRSSV
ncbi:MAG TPA: alpha/beta hydrolase [Acidimicrobiales bacterium]